MVQTTDRKCHLTNRVNVKESTRKMDNIDDLFSVFSEESTVQRSIIGVSRSTSKPETRYCYFTQRT